MFSPLLSILHTLHHSTPLQLSRKTSCHLENYIKNKNKHLKYICISLKLKFLYQRILSVVAYLPRAEQRRATVKVD